MPEHYTDSGMAAWEVRPQHRHAVWMGAHCLYLVLQGKGMTCSQARGLCLCIAVSSDLHSLR